MSPTKFRILSSIDLVREFPGHVEFRNLTHPVREQRSRFDALRLIVVEVEEDVRVDGCTDSTIAARLAKQIGVSQIAIPDGEPFAIAATSPQFVYGDPVPEVDTQGLGNPPAARVEDES
jgi:hypothetical protein